MKKAIVLAVLCVSLWALIPVVAKLGQESSVCDGAMAQ